MVVRAETQLGSQPHVEIAHPLEFVDEFFRIDLGTDALDGFGQNARIDVALERDVIGGFAGKIFVEGRFVFQI